MLYEWSSRLFPVVCELGGNPVTSGCISIKSKVQGVGRRSLECVSMSSNLQDLFLGGCEVDWPTSFGISVN